MSALQPATLWPWPAWNASSQRVQALMQHPLQGLAVAHLAGLWRQLAAHWALPGLAQTLEPLGHAELGWLHAGLDGQGQPYLIVYCPLAPNANPALEPGDARFQQFRQHAGHERARS